MGSAPLMASDLHSISKMNKLLSRDSLMVRTKAILIPIFFLDLEIRDRHLALSSN